MIGGAGLGVDVTQWYLWQRELQMSVDTAALAGAYSKVQGKDYNVSANAALTDNKQVLDYLGTPSVTVVSWSGGTNNAVRSEEHTSELQSLMRISYAVFCLKKKTTHKNA